MGSCEMRLSRFFGFWNRGPFFGGFTLINAPWVFDLRFQMGNGEELSWKFPLDGRDLKGLEGSRPLGVFPPVSGLGMDLLWPF